MSQADDQRPTSQPAWEAGGGWGTAATDDERLAAALARAGRWRGVELRVRPLTGGITNRNYQVEAAGEVYVLRLSGDKTELLGIDRRVERAANEAAARLGLAPEVVDFIEPEGWLVTRFIEGRPIPPAEMRRPEGLGQVAMALRKIHRLPAISSAFSPFRVVEDYHRLATERGVRTLPADFAGLLSSMRAIEAALAHEPMPACFCHNDLLNENFLAEAATGGLRILDWEYAGMGDPFFDLGNFSAHHELGDDDEALFLDMYVGEVMPRHVARLKLMRCMSDFREAMWGVLQSALSTLEFDFEGYAAKYFGRLRAGFDHPLFPAWLAEMRE